MQKIFISYKKYLEKCEILYTFIFNSVKKKLCSFQHFKIDVQGMHITPSNCPKEYLPSNSFVCLVAYLLILHPPTK